MKIVEKNLFKTIEDLKIKLFLLIIYKKDFLYRLIYFLSF